MDEASFALRRLLAEGRGVVYLIPDVIPGHSTFAYSAEEAEYVEQMAVHLFWGEQGDPSWFVQPKVKGLHDCPRPYAYSKPLVALQKSACSLMRLYSVAVVHLDWSTYHAAGKSTAASSYPRRLNVAYPCAISRNLHCQSGTPSRP